VPCIIKYTKFLFFLTTRCATGTLCIINARFGALPKFSVHLLSPSNHFDLTFQQNKIKANKMLCLVLN